MAASTVPTIHEINVRTSDLNKSEILRERILREEIRHYHLIQMRIMHWGVTVLASVQTLLYFVRREVTLSLQEQHLLAQGAPLPLHRYWLGTAFLMVLAILAFCMASATSSKLGLYRRQLSIDPNLPTASGIFERRVGPFFRYATMSTFFVFPCFDIAARIYLHLWVV
jgi:hypothetical protein